MDDIPVKKISEYVYEIPKSGDMLVPGRIYGNKEIIDHLIQDVKAGKAWNALKQIVNVACLPGIQKASMAMSDVHPGYGFPIGGVGAFDLKEGVISVAGIGFDINCGVRTLRTPLTKEDVEKKKKIFADELFRNIPAGLGSTGKIKLTKDQIDEVLVRGAKYSLEMGYGIKSDLNFIENNGVVKNANPENVSDLAKKRQFKQVGTLGSGNHYMEIQYVDEIFDENAAKVFGLEKGQILISLHCGSRALGHQVGTDYLKELYAASLKYKIPIRERELVCAPIQSEEGQRYFSAVNCGTNCAFANRQVLGHLAREVTARIFSIDENEIETLYEVGHNTGKIEKHSVGGKKKELLVLRKGATRAFGPGRTEIPKDYRKIGQPVLVGGTMGTCSYILHGTQKGMNDTFGSAIHGAGRNMSRMQAKRTWRAEDLLKDLEKKGIIVKGHSFNGISEEAPEAYKDATDVVNVMHNSGIALKVAKLKPLISIKG